jgi:uroporphyrinogen decarboxylase
MNGKERFLTALAGGQPDMVPVWELAFNEESIIKIGRLYADDVPPVKLVHQMTLEEKIALLELLYANARRLGLDGLTSMHLYQRDPVDEKHVRDAWGRVLYVDREGDGIPVEGPVSGPSDLGKLKIVHPQDSEFLMLMLSIQKLGGDVAHVFHMTGPFRESWAMMGGIQKLLYYYAEDPAFVKDLTRICTDYILEAVEKAVGLGADAVAIVSDLAFNENTMMSPANYAEFLLPYHKEITDFVHRRGLKVIKHSDGRLWRIMDLLHEAGFDGMHPVQPQCMDIAEMKAKYGKKFCLLGNIDCEHLLPFGTEQEVDETVRKTIAAAAPGGGYIISSSNTIHPGCKAENYAALVGAARKYGQYPLNSA